MSKVSKRIDLAYFYTPGTSLQVDWEYGTKCALPLPLKHTAFAIECLLNQTDAEWILFWDYNLGEPDIELIEQLSSRPVDAWHCGLKLGLGDAPDILNYMHPTWMYNKDAGTEIEHTSFRLSLSACLVRVAAIKKTGIFSAAYQSAEMAGIAWGYSILKQGGIIRYHPGIIKDQLLAKVSVPARDEWVFARQFFPKKWQWWTLFNKGHFFENYRIWRSTRGISSVSQKPVVHNALKEGVLKDRPTVSVLMPTLDRYPYLVNELEQLSQQTVLPYEVLITDQTDKQNREQIDFSKYTALAIKYFPQDEKGQCVAWNKLLEEATGEYVLFLGDDADGIAPDFIEKLLLSRERFDSDMVASNVIELGIKYKEINPYYYLSDSFPITLIKRSVLLKSGFMDMFFNRNIRADHDLAMRCHANGAMMIFDSCATIYHHRAPAGGLRAHNARVVTSYMAKNSVSKFLNPTSSEIYIANKYYSQKQKINYIKIKYFNQLAMNGSVINKIVKSLLFTLKAPQLYRVYKQNEKAANIALAGKQKTL